MRCAAGKRHGGGHEHHLRGTTFAHIGVSSQLQQMSAASQFAPLSRK
jgi:hypothetical protein